MATTAMFSREMMTKAMADDKFFALLPEFSVLKAKLKTMDAQFASKGGCSSCAKRRVEQNIIGDFIIVLVSLPASQMQTFKRYVGVDGVVVNTQNPRTGAFETHRL